MENEEEALARALELSRIEDQQGQAASASPDDHNSRPLFSRQPPHGNWVTSMFCVINVYKDFLAQKYENI